MPSTPLLQTGQHTCYDQDGNVIPCVGSGQDAEFGEGLAWPTPRLEQAGEIVIDHLTGLQWSRDANLAQFPLTWQEALDFIAGMNTDQALGHDDWRLPNRRELRSLMSYQARKPALPEGHPFTNVFLGWYWSSTTAAIDPRYAWYVHLEGARMFYGRKDQYYLLWPVRGSGNGLLAATGQDTAYDGQGQEMEADGSGQDGELQLGRPWPTPRFVDQGDMVLDRLTNLLWATQADLSGEPVSWQQALDAVANLNREEFAGLTTWRLPNINALESLVDCRCHQPALPADHPFRGLRDVYWSATTSFFETDWAWALYLDKGALGVGFKTGRTFYVWPVAPGPEPHT
ncbi:MAG: hypothetical protein C0613_06470 [Desulfobulbaceae bacterium]|nr:MAG: hypothetical protein C0613_06470 [Desulfobulbaceae bacterium]